MLIKQILNMFTTVWNKFICTNYFTLSFPDQGKSFWVGANDKNAVPTFKWTDGKPLVIAGQPHTDLTRSNCLLIRSDSTYNFHNCPAKHGFICERIQSVRP